MRQQQQQNTDLAPAEHELAIAGPEYGVGTDPAAGGGAPPANPLHKVHMLLRGRYKWAVGLALALGAAGAATGYLAGKRTYMSSAQIRFLPVLPRVLTADDDKGAMPFFDPWVDAQVTLLQSQRIVDMALQDEEWRRTGRKSDAEAVQELREEGLAVVRPRGSQVVFVNVTDPDGAAAQAAAKALVAAYEKIAEEQDAMSGERRMELLNAELAQRTRDLQAKMNEIGRYAGEFGTREHLQKKYDYQFEQVNLHDATVRRLTLALATSTEAPAAAAAAGDGVKDGAAAGTEGGAGQPQQPAALSVEEIAQRDGQMAQLLNERWNLTRRVTVLRQQGVLDRHRDMTRAQAEVAAVNEQIEARAAVVRKMVADGPAVAGAAGAAGTTPGLDGGMTSRKALETQLAAVRALYDENLKELMGLGEKRQRIEQLHLEADQLREVQDQVRRRIEQLNLEQKVGGRLQVLSRGDRPVVAKDMRPKLAAAGGMGGAALGVGLVLLVGLLDRRFRSPEELKASMTGSPMLGVLPELPDDLSDPEQAALTAHFVHQIRTLLQIWDNSGRGQQVFSVTSPVAGTGKTSLTLALGVSFAAADSRTLLIDCDLIGGGLTSRANAIVKRKIGRILQREGLLTDRQLDEALKLARGSRRRLGEILVELGHLKESELDTALVAQQKANVGLLDAINGEDLAECVAGTGIPGLDILPLGGAMAQHASKVSPQALRRVLQAARQRYDTILIDTGPVPGSLEASVVAAEVDGVILCVSRGEQRPLAERCVGHLVSIGARVAGVVFNRAKTTDMNVYGTTARLGTSVPVGGSGPVRPADSSRFGPMARAVTYSGTGADGAGEGGEGDSSGAGQP